MFLNSRFNNKTVKELRKNQGLTARELADKMKLNQSIILKIDERKLKEVPEPLRTRIIPILRGDNTDKIPWL